MAKFVFQLAAVLRHRELAEEQRQRELAIQQAAMTRLEGELRRLNESMHATANDLRDNHLTGRLDMNFLAAHRRYTIAVQRQAMELVQKMAVQQRLVDEARRALAEAAKQRKIMEKLREREH